MISEKLITGIKFPVMLKEYNYLEKEGREMIDVIEKNDPQALLRRRGIRLLTAMDLDKKLQKIPIAFFLGFMYDILQV